MKKIKEFIKRIPWYGYVGAAVLFGSQYGIYRLGDWISRITGSINHVVIPKIAIIDNHIPLIPFFVVIYLFSYVFWICAPIAVSLTKKENFINYVIGYYIALFIGALFFVFMPTAMNRVEEGLIEQMSKPGLFNKLLGIVYGADGGEYAFNLFPSYHCLLSIYCYYGVLRQPEIKKGFKIYSLVMAFLIVLSTVFTKQHYFIDIIGGLGIATIVYFIINKINPGKKILEKKNQLVKD